MIIPFKKPKNSLSASFIIDRIHVIFPIFFLSILLCILFIDKPAAQFLSHIPYSLFESLSFFLKLFTPMLWTLVLPFAFFYLRFFLRKDRKSRKIWYLSLALPITLLICFALQRIIGKASPEWFFSHQDVPFRFFETNALFHSFPSAHSSVIACLGVGFAALYPKKGLLLIIISAFLSLLPAVISYSFFSDALAGLFTGALTAQFVYKKFRRDQTI